MNFIQLYSEINLSKTSSNYYLTLKSFVRDMGGDIGIVDFINDDNLIAILNANFGNSDYFTIPRSDYFINYLNRIITEHLRFGSLIVFDENYDISSYKRLNFVLVDNTNTYNFVANVNKSSYRAFVAFFLEIPDLFSTNLYSELIDNTETESMLKTYINDGDVSGYTDKDIEIMRLIEKYNKNVLALRATRKVEIENTINTSSDDSSTVDLTTVNQQLTNINNALHYINTDDVVKNLTEVVAENDKSVLVENNVIESAPYNPHLKKYDLFEG